LESIERVHLVSCLELFFDWLAISILNHSAALDYLVISHYFIVPLMLTFAMQTF
jgi:hypothetical protein